MRRLNASIKILALTVFAGFAAMVNAQQPNFVFIQGEGQGWASTSIQLDPNEPGSKSRSFFTPNLERLAREGVRFSNYYAPSPRCTPSRATYFTGISSARLRMTFTSPGGDTGKALIEPRVLRELPAETTTVAELLKGAGYATAHFGKWHVGRADPRVHGFDESDGATSNSGPENSRNPNPKQAYGITERGVDFIRRQVKANKPFYLQLSHYGGKSQADAKPETFEKVLKLGLGRNERNIGAAAVALDVDTTIGMLLDKLDELGIANNTYVIYTADHGTPGRNGPLQGGKGGLWDGGIRIPLLIRGPLAKRGTHSSVLTTGADLVPTIADLAGVADRLPKEVEGGSLKPLLADPAAGKVDRRASEIVFHFPHYDKDPLGPVSAIIADNFKLIRVYEDSQNLLFDLSKDIGERKDLAADLPDKVHELDQRLTKYLASVGAESPKARTRPITDLPNAKPTRTLEQQPPGQQKQQGRKGGGGGLLFKTLDTDADGVLSAKEIDNALAALMKLDKNKDGQLTSDELRSRGGGGKLKRSGKDGKKGRDQKQPKRQEGAKP